MPREHIPVRDFSAAGFQFINLERPVMREFTFLTTTFMYGSNKPTYIWKIDLERIRGQYTKPNSQYIADCCHVLAKHHHDLDLDPTANYIVVYNCNYSVGEIVFRVKAVSAT